MRHRPIGIGVQVRLVLDVAVLVTDNATRFAKLTSRGTFDVIVCTVFKTCLLFD